MEMERKLRGIEEEGLKERGRRLGEGELERGGDGEREKGGQRE